MDSRDFLHLAKTLVKGATEVEWRTGVSRGYYAAFHVARRLLSQCRFDVPRSEHGHAYLWLRLANSGAALIQEAGNNLNLLRRDRNRADYDLDRPLTKATAVAQVQAAEEIIRALTAAEREPLKSAITEAIKTYERDILKTVTLEGLGEPRPRHSSIKAQHTWPCPHHERKVYAFLSQSIG